MGGGSWTGCFEPILFGTLDRIRLTAGHGRVDCFLLRIAFIKLPPGTLTVRKETILNVFPSNDESQRLVIAVEQQEAGPSRLVLRQESFSEDVGWFVQSRIAVEPEQIAGLKMSLTGQALKQIQPPARSIPPVPAILRFDRRAAGQAG